MMPKKQPTLDDVAKKMALDEAVENCEYFIDEFVYIENPDTGEPTKFSLWPDQRRALRDMLENKLTVMPKSRQIGITWLALAVSTWMKFQPGDSTLALSRTEEDAKELVRRTDFILRHLPPWMIVQSNAPLPGQLTYDRTATQIVVRHPDKEDSYFRSFPAGPNSGRSHTGRLLMLDEWAFQDYARDIWKAAFPTVNRPTGGKVFGISTMELGTLFEEVVRGAMSRSNDFKLVFLPWTADPRRDADWYEKTKRAIGADAMKREYPATVRECLESAGGRFFWELREDVHIKKPLDSIPRDYRRYLSIDYGTDMLAAIWYYIDYDGYARVYRERHQSGLSVTEASELIKEANAGDKLHAIFAPDDLWNTQNTAGKSPADIFAENGLRLTKTHRRREQGWILVREWLYVHDRKMFDGTVEKTARLTIDERAAPELWRCLNTILSDKNNPRDAAKDPHDVTHLPDSLRAFCVYWQHPSKDTTPLRLDSSISAREARRIERLGKEHKHGRKFQFV
jgi:hypothetical protein